MIIFVLVVFLYLESIYLRCPLPPFQILGFDTSMESLLNVGGRSGSFVDLNSDFGLSGKSFGRDLFPPPGKEKLKAPSIEAIQLMISSSLFSCPKNQTQFRWQVAE